MGSALSSISYGSVLSYIGTITLTYIVGQFGQKFIWADRKPDGEPKSPWAPSPQGLPRFLNAYSIFEKESYHALTRWSQEVGEFFSVKIGAKRITVLNSAHLVHQFLVEKEQFNSSKLPSDTLEKMVTDHSKTIHSAPFANYWARLRRGIYIVIGALYIGQFSKYFKAQAKKLSVGIEGALREDNSITAKQLRQLVNLIAMDTALTMVVGEETPRDAESMLTLIQKCKELEERQSTKKNRAGQFYAPLNSLLDVASLFSMDTGLIKQRNGMLDIILPWFDPIYQKRRDAIVNVSEEEKKKILSSDKLDAIAKSLLNIEPSKNDPEPVQLTKAEALVNVWHITLHAYTYLSATIFTLIQRLATEPELQARLFEERKSNVEEKTLAKAFVHESLRIDSPHRLLAYNPRADYEVTIDEKLYRIDENSEIVVNIDAIHKNPSYYPKPDIFDPVRFLKSEKKKTPLLEFGQSAGRKIVKDHLAFGAGRRACMGTKASEEILVDVLYQIVKQYQLKGGDVLEKVEHTTNLWSWTGRTETKGASIEFIKR